MTPIVSDDDFELHHGDVLEVLPRLERECFDAIVTSPPYLDVRSDVTGFARHDWGELLDELRRVLKPSGSLMLNLGRIHRDGEEVLWAHDLLGAARELGWRVLDEIIWHKVNGGGGRRTSYLIDRHEHVFWLALRTDPYKGFDEARQPYSPATLARFSRKWSARNGAVKGKDSPAQDGRVANPDGAKPGSVFVCSIGAEKGIKHPTPMAPELAEFLVKLACPPGGSVLDPFAGACTTALACRKLGRSSVGIDVDGIHCDECAERLGQQSLLSGAA